MGLAKHCRFNPKLYCNFVSCSRLDSFGNVEVCRFVPNPEGLMQSRKVAVSPVYVWSKHRGRCLR